MESETSALCGTTTALLPGSKRGQGGGGSAGSWEKRWQASSLGLVGLPAVIPMGLAGPSVTLIRLGVSPALYGEGA